MGNSERMDFKKVSRQFTHQVKLTPIHTPSKKGFQLKAENP
jgi:hypothetical protein